MTRRCLAAFLPLLACLLWAPDLAAGQTPRGDRPLQVWATTADRRLALAALLAVSGRASAQVTTGAITGVVTDEQGQPVEAAQIDLPDEGAIHIPGVDSLRSEPGNDNSAIGCRSRAGIGRFDVPLFERHSLICDPFPYGFSGQLVD